MKTAETTTAVRASVIDLPCSPGVVIDKSLLVVIRSISIGPIDNARTVCHASEQIGTLTDGNCLAGSIENFVDGDLAKHPRGRSFFSQSLGPAIGTVPDIPIQSVAVI